MSEKRVGRIVDRAQGWVAQGIHPALVILVARRGVVVIHEAFGRLTPVQDALPLELDTIFPVSSLTKPITATAAMILVEDGLLGLNRPLWWYIPEFAGEGKDVVGVHHLLTHTSGLRDEDVDAYAKEKKVSVEIPPLDEETQHPLLHEYLCLRYGAPLWKPPGTEMSYSSYGYNLLGEIVRRVSGRSLADFARERIFEPLGMKDTHYVLPESLYPRVVRRPSDAPGFGIDNRERHGPWGAAGAFSTAKDMAIFGQMFLNRGRYGDARILSPASVAEMTRNQIPGISSRIRVFFYPEACWGLGWNVRGSKNSVAYAEKLQSPETFSHGGWGGVFMWVDPVHEIVGVYFSVATCAGFPAGVVVPEWMRGAVPATRVDLLINPVTAAVVDG
jgi:CubicO group peptidase (beta-lactamase class C family)